MCSCSFFQNCNVKGKETCLHIIWVLMNYFRISEDNNMIQQVALTKAEVAKIFEATPNVEILSPEEGSSIITEAEIKSILDSKSKALTWRIGKLKTGKTTARCATCKAAMLEHKVFVQTDGWFIPPNQKFAVERKFYFCATFKCLNAVSRSTVVAPTKDVIFEIIPGADLTADDIDLLRYREFQF